MLLITDRLTEGGQLLRLLRRIGPCKLVTHEQALKPPVDHSIIICDVSFDNATSIDLVSAAIAHYRIVPEIPLLCLARDPSHLTLTQAKAVGATAVLPCQTAPGQLLSTIKTLIRPDPNGLVDRHDPTTQACARDAALALHQCLKRRGYDSPFRQRRCNTAVRLSSPQSGIRTSEPGSILFGAMMTLPTSTACWSPGFARRFR